MNGAQDMVARHARGRRLSALQAQHRERLALGNAPPAQRGFQDDAAFPLSLGRGRGILVPMSKTKF